MFIAKKLLSQLFFPVPLCAGLLVLGLVLWRFTKRKKLGRALLVVATGLLLLFGYPWLSRALLRNLESRYPPVAARAPGAQAAGGDRLIQQFASVKTYVAVLGKGIVDNPDLPAGARFSPMFLQRLVEGVRLHRLLPNSTLLLSISTPSVPEAEKQRVAREFVWLFGLQTNSVRLCVTAWETEDEIEWFKETAGTNPVFLVTCASHLPRVMLLARQQGLRAIPSPSGFLAGKGTNSTFNPACLFPNSANFANTERAFYEYLGLAWTELRGSKAQRQGGAGGKEAAKSR